MWEVDVEKIVFGSGEMDVGTGGENKIFFIHPISRFTLYRIFNSVSVPRGGVNKRSTL